MTQPGTPSGAHSLARYVTTRGVDENVILRDGVPPRLFFQLAWRRGLRTECPQMVQDDHFCPLREGPGRTVVAPPHHNNSSTLMPLLRALRHTLQAADRPANA